MHFIRFIELKSVFIKNLEIIIIWRNASKRYLWYKVFYDNIFNLLRWLKSYDLKHISAHSKFADSISDYADAVGIWNPDVRN